MKLPGLSQYCDQGATFDEPERRYRFQLWRRWANGTIALWIMLNPSTADEHVLDPTLRKVEGFTRRMGHSGFIVCNLFAFRSPDPDRLYDEAIDLVIAERNASDISAAATASSIIVCGWGSHRIAEAPSALIRARLRRRRLYCLGTNQNGSPKHPLYLKNSTPLKIFQQEG